MIRNIIFDMGNVLRRFEPELCIRHYAADANDAALLNQVVFGSAEWLMLDRGTITYEEAENRWAARLPEHLRQPLHEMLPHWHEYLPAIPGMAELARDLKAAGYHNYLFSNVSVRIEQIKETLAAAPYLDGIIASAHYQLMKPEPAFYQVLFDTFNLKPEECFFIDDYLPNIEAGRALGMAGHVFDYHDMPALYAALKAVGVEW